MTSETERADAAVRTSSALSVDAPALDRSAVERGIAASSARLSGVADQPSPHAVFVHSSFRTSSTWFWHKLRSLPNTIAYYEFFHEALSDFKCSNIRDMTHETWPSKHPPSAPYFIEYLPLLNDAGGIPGYERDMSTGRFIPSGGMDGHLSIAEKVYISRLIENSHWCRKIPVLTCTRTLGRAKALKRSEGGYHILLYRNILHQWASYCGQALNGNPYFNIMTDMIVRSSRHDPFIMRLDKYFHRRTCSPNDRDFFCMFVILHIYLYAHAAEAADLVVDVGRCTKDALYRRDLEVELSMLFQQDLDLSDAKLGFEIAAVDLSSGPTIIDTVEQFCKMICDQSLSPSAAAFARRVQQDFVEELHTHEFYCAGYRRFAERRLGEAQQNEERSKEETARLLGQIERLTGETSQAAVAAEVLTRERDSLVAAAAERAAENAQLAAHLAQSKADSDLRNAEREELVSQVAALLAAKDALASERDQVAAQAAALLTARDALAGERDATMASLAENRAASTRLYEQVEQLEARLSEASDGKNRLAEDNQRLLAEVSDVTAARDRLIGEHAEQVAQLEAAAASRVAQAGEPRAGRLRLWSGLR